MRMFLVVASVVYLLAACGSPGGATTAASGEATVHGTLLGKTFTPVDATSYTQDALVYFVLSDAPGACGDLVANTVKASSSALFFYLPDVTVGMTYGGPSVQFAEFDATCNSPAGESGSGTVTITAASATSVSGTFAFSLNSYSVTGTFVAPNCAGAPGAGAQVCR
jgi:hypothetical protein